MDKLKDALKELGKSDYYPFHMPGHKRRAGEYFDYDPCLEDITEIDGFDNLHHPEGILKEEQEFAAGAFGSEESFFLINVYLSASVTIHASRHMGIFLIVRGHICLAMISFSSLPVLKSLRAFWAATAGCVNPCIL